MSRRPESPPAQLVRFTDGGREDRALLGGKGANLAELTALALPVPPGFVITTAAWAEYTATGALPPGLLADASRCLAEVGQAVGRRFGDLQQPLLVSVRSGAPVSMPGMMDTILNVGATVAGLDGLAAELGDRDLALDCLRRLGASFAATVGGALPEDPSDQLEQAIVAVFASWNSPRAQRYRRFHRLADTGTAVVVQAMVFGNAGDDSGTGVLFTRDPSTGENRLFGDYLPSAQGEDIVAGTHNALDLTAMERTAPAAYRQLETFARTIETHFGDMSEIEFTVERGRLWILQTRTGQRSVQAAVRIATELAGAGAIDRLEAVRRVDAGGLDAQLQPLLDRGRVAENDVIAHGIGASPGVVTGRVAFDSEQAVAFKAAGAAVVLARPETRPEDLEGILAADGLLTTRGGKTSHAAVVARGLGRCCVCGAESIEIDVAARRLSAGDVVIGEGDLVSLDGEAGWIIRGTAPVLAGTMPPELGRSSSGRIRTRQ